MIDDDDEIGNDGNLYYYHISYIIYHINVFLDHDWVFFYMLQKSNKLDYNLVVIIIIFK